MCISVMIKGLYYIEAVLVQKCTHQSFATKKKKLLQSQDSLALSLHPFPHSVFGDL